MFLFRNYRASLAKWQTADPLGYPDGWNQQAYCGNEPIANIDFLGAYVVGDVKPVPGSGDVMNGIVGGTTNGGEVSYSLAGYDIENHFKGEDFLYYFWKGSDLYGMFQQNFEREVWEILDVSMTFSKPTLLSWLTGKTGVVGDIGGWMSLFLSRIPSIGASSTIAQAIGKLEDSFKDQHTIQLGQVARLKSKDPWIKLVERLIE